MYAHRVEKPTHLNLKDFETKVKDMEKDEALDRTQKLGEELSELAELMYAAGQHSLLIVLQGMDTAGKDGAIRAFLDHLNGQSASIASFKVPTPDELGHDFLWRVHKQTPLKGSTVIFNRSHYEDVLVVRVHSIVPEAVWRKRYDQINAFEQLVASSNTIILKFFLHISKDEQEERLREREQDPTKAWKLSVGDWKERELWEDYQDAYADAVGKCAAENAPWYIVPANQKWFRNLAVLEAVVETLRPYREGWMSKLNEIGTKAKSELEEYRKTL